MCIEDLGHVLLMTSLCVSGLVDINCEFFSYALLYSLRLIIWLLMNKRIWIVLSSFTNSVILSEVDQLKKAMVLKILIIA